MLPPKKLGRVLLIKGGGHGRGDASKGEKAAAM